MIWQSSPILVSQAHQISGNILSLATLIKLLAGLHYSTPFPRPFCHWYLSWLNTFERHYPVSLALRIPRSLDTWSPGRQEIRAPSHPSTHPLWPWLYRTIGAIGSPSSHGFSGFWWQSFSPLNSSPFLWCPWLPTIAGSLTILFSPASALLQDT